MKKSAFNIFVYKIVLATMLAYLMVANGPLDAAQLTNQPFFEISPRVVLTAMQRVADWQLAHPSKHRPTDWTQGAGDAGMMALAGIAGNPKYRQAMLAMGASNHWQLGPRLYMADDHCVGQTYAELYLLYRENKMITPLRRRFDEILANPSRVKNLNIRQPHGTQRWSWCDSLFMGPPTWMRLYAATGDRRYRDFAVSNWWQTTHYLYDTNEHLFFRDSTFFHKREANGQKVFWGRGNGWVVAGLVRVLQYLPMNDPSRPRFERLFKQMAHKILSCQQPDGLWRASLLDPMAFPLKETSGSGFFTYALAWGINQGLLDRSQFGPAVSKAWEGLLDCVNADGKLTHVQPGGGSPVKFDPNDTEVYGVGAFLLAGSEVYRLAVLEKTEPVGVKVTNPADFRRVCETVELNLPTVAARLHLNPATGKFAVMDGVSSRILNSQVYASEPGQQPDKLLFQVDLAPRETRTYYVLNASALAAVPPPIVKTFARYVPERDDDFAWESDRIAHRMYGPALMTAPGGSLTSSGVDVWIKRTRRLIINQLYASGHYHQDNGVAMDDYRVGASRGDGGLGVWGGKRLYVSSNYHHWKLLTTGPIRSVFELTYDPWNTGGGRMVSETKRISIDANSWFSKAQSTFASEDKSPLTIGVGLAERACGPDGKELVARNKTEGWMTYWQPDDRPKGHTGVAIVLPKNSVEEFTNDKPDLPKSKIHAAVPQPTVEGAPPIRDLLAITQVKVGKPFTYYFGACWDRSGDFTNHVQWEDYVKRFAERRDAPLQVSLEGM